MSRTAQDIADQLMAAAGDDPDLAQELGRLFVDELVRLRAELRSYAQTGDVKKFQHAAHTLKGCSSSIGFVQVAEHALALELLARDGLTDTERVPAEMERLAVSCDVADRDVRAYLAAAP